MTIPQSSSSTTTTASQPPSHSKSNSRNKKWRKNTRNTGDDINGQQQDASAVGDNKDMTDINATRGGHGQQKRRRNRNGHQNKEQHSHQQEDRLESVDEHDHHKHSDSCHHHHHSHDASSQHSHSSNRKRNRNHRGNRGGRGRGRGSGGNRGGGQHHQKKFSAFSRVRRNVPQDDASSLAGSPTPITPFNGDFLSRTEIMMHELNKGTHECCVCSEHIKPKQKTWSCHEGCHAAYHLHCIKKWANSQVDSYSKWKCPLCSYDYSEKPNTYKCWCQKHTNPYFNPSIPAHSCGNTCEHIFENCPHTCSMVCHPGDHPPCEGTQQASCACGKETFLMKCSEVSNNAAQGKKISCGAVCGRIKNCGVHQCSLTCGHEGDCPSCEEITEQMCYCGKHMESKICEHAVRDFSHGDLRTFSCDEICGKKFPTCDCTCQKKCHPGSCGECQRLPSRVKYCVCGKTPLSQLLTEPRKSCSDPIPTCNEKHGAPMPCGVHLCTRTCHEGDCGECLKMVRINCRCGKKTVNLPCVFTYINWEEAKEKRPEFVKMLTEKYLEPSHLEWPLRCQIVCNKRKSCLRHKCSNVCCPGGDLHICTRICNRQLSCKKHRCDLHCHAGNCPGCSRVIREPLVCKCGKTRLEPPQVCGTKLPACPFPCTIERECGHPSRDHKCHETGECPPCSEKVSKMCIGNHVLVENVPCGLREVCCSNNCGRVLSCGNPDHTCKRGCHVGECTKISEGESCTFPCLAALPCGHRCQKTCHPGSSCEEEGCSQKLKVFCDCRRIKKWMNCGDVQNLMEEKFPDIPFNVKDIPDILECDSECRRLARNEGLAEALGVDVIKCNLPVFPMELLEFGSTRNGLKFIEYLEENFEKLIDDRKRQQLIFRPMNRDKRVMLHTLTDFYRIISQSIDQGVNRSVSISKTPSSRVPKYLLSEVLKDPKKMEKLEIKLKELGIDKSTQTAYVPLTASRSKRHNVEELDVSQGHVVETLTDVEESLQSSRLLEVQRQKELGNVIETTNSWSALLTENQDQ
eukprot:CAMPEP_0117434936 /NCGR_PEP_ID=MMETSP0759-20121206/213_1 /TAXON_ID=63605 /ORGANISM="Percolomonas cosmopolitus, Strain WS" /LENGTH=1023 /DNA_ID=CAMNT_0005226449 /DNA_START=9 /DNA_END=3080 /DNA_ORIENTATION=-